MANRKTMFSYYKKKEQADVAQDVQPISVTQGVDVAQEVEPTPESNIQDCPVDKQYEIRKAYMKLGPYQPIKDVYHSSGLKSHPRRFQSHWFNEKYSMEEVMEKASNEDIIRNRLRLKTSIDVVKRNAKYISPDIQKEILHIIATNVQMSIRKEIGDAKLCLLVDEARDESKREQMALVIRFVDSDGFIRERFLDLIHVPDTTATTLKQELWQGYDGASNMRGEWNGLQRKFSEDCPYAYYVHCFAHQLQLALVAASKEVTEVYNFFEHLAVVVNVVASSYKRNDELRANQLETGANQIGALQSPCETRWSSHFSSICRLLKLYKVAFLVLKDRTSSKGPRTSPSARAKAAGAVKLMMSFDFVFILHLMKELMGITDLLCKKLQQKSQDIVNAMHDVATTQILIQKLRDDGWSGLLSDVVSFCEKLEIPVLDMRSFYVDYIRSRREDKTSVGHHYQYDVFTVAVDQQLQELNNRFSEQTTELLILCNSLDPRDLFKSFKLDDVCLLATKFYPYDFSDQERENLRYQLRHYQTDVHLICRLIRFILTLPVSTGTTERAFSAMKLVKTRLRNKMEDEYLRDCLLIYIEKEKALEFAIDTLIDYFSAKKRQRVDLK
ncbi:hypothetical protein BS78_02G201200 [Paspalum vaginatum]|nr:hypothetical protein BS78_02G201200 [Paspalum vaginatum]